MKVQLKMFAILKERSGAGEVELELAAGDTVSRAIELIGQRYAGVADLLPRAAVAVNLAYVPRSTVLREGDELALIPPVSGGCP